MYLQRENDVYLQRENVCVLTSQKSCELYLVAKNICIYDIRNYW